jgi:hypothetical protein
MAFPYGLYEFLMTAMSSYIHPGRMQFQQKQPGTQKAAGPGKPLPRYFAECVRSTGSALHLEDRDFENHLFFERTARSSSLVRRFSSGTAEYGGGSSALSQLNFGCASRSSPCTSTAASSVERWWAPIQWTHGWLLQLQR